MGIYRCGGVEDCRHGVWEYTGVGTWKIAEVVEVLKHYHWGSGVHSCGLKVLKPCGVGVHKCVVKSKITEVGVLKPWCWSTHVLGLEDCRGGST